MTISLSMSEELKADLTQSMATGSSVILFLVNTSEKEEERSVQKLVLGENGVDENNWFDKVSDVLVEHINKSKFGAFGILNLSKMDSAIRNSEEGTANNHFNDFLNRRKGQVLGFQLLGSKVGTGSKMQHALYLNNLKQEAGVKVFLSFESEADLDISSFADQASKRGA